jgi:hypothetical protein
MCKVYPSRIDDFISVNEVRYQVMKNTEGCLNVFMIKLPFFENVFVRCIVWSSKEKALRYCGGRLQRERYLDFLKEYVQDLAIFFIDEININNMEDVPEHIKSTYFKPVGETSE